MTKTILMTIIFWCALSWFAIADECNTAESPLVDLLNQYSVIHGTKFIVDPRVRAKVTLVGIDTQDIDSAMLIGILNIHGFTALTSDRVVYVMPASAAEVHGDEFGDRWEG